LIAYGRSKVCGWATLGICEAETKKTELILNPEQQGTYFPQSLQTAGDPVSPADLSQTQVGLALADGRARATLTAAALQKLHLPTNVEKWAEINGSDPNLLTPFVMQLACLV
jgi:hypothetical protein